VAEFFYEEEFGQAHTLSALIGAIWQVMTSCRSTSAFAMRQPTAQM
jgi:hypothetical protein